jgi:hypothetical protein
MMEQNQKNEVEGKLTDAERVVLEALNSACVISGDQLANLAGMVGAKSDTRRRRLRELIWHLRSRHRIPILSSPLGYWLAETPEDIKPFCQRMQQYGRDHLAIASIVKGVTVDVEAGQMLLDMFDEERPVEGDSAHKKAWEMFLTAGSRRIKLADVLGQTLNLMKKNPELFEANARILEKEYGVMVLSPEQARKLEQAKKLLSDVA